MEELTEELLCTPSHMKNCFIRWLERRGWIGGSNSGVRKTSYETTVIYDEGHSKDGNEEEGEI